MEKIDESGKRETLSDIVADLRAKARKFIGYHGVGWCEGGRLMSLADRIEAAAKRERAEIESDALAVGGVVEAARHKPGGNAAAMREALVEMTDKVLDYMHKGLIQLPLPLEDATAKARAALSSPARNCDRYKDAPSAYADFIVPWKLDGHLDDVPTLQDFANWLFAPAAERKGEGDGE